MHEQRLNMRLLQYWNTLRKDNPLPQIQKFNWVRIEDLWPYCAIVDLDTRQSSSVLYRYTYIGKPLVIMMGEDLTGFTVHPRMRGLPAMPIIQRLDEVIATKAPVMEENHFSNAQGKLIKYRGCFLPFGNDKNGITNILVGITHRSY